MKKKAAGRTKNQFGKNEVRKRAAVMNHEACTSHVGEDYPGAGR